MVASQIETLETEKRGLVDTGRRNNEIFKKRMAAATQDKTQAAEAIAALQARVDALQAEHEGLTTQMSAAPTAEALATLTAQVETLIREKSALEKSLAEATAVAATGAVHDEANETIVSTRVGSCFQTYY
jgi:predicted  nucleic acid-binding Zn-ribbon protein